MQSGFGIGSQRCKPISSGTIFQRSTLPFEPLSSDDDKRSRRSSRLRAANRRLDDYAVKVTMLISEAIKWAEELLASAHTHCALCDGPCRPEAEVCWPCCRELM